MKRHLTIIALVLVATAAAGTAAAEETRWLKVTVEEAGEGATVNLNLPLDMVLTIIRSIEVEGFDAGKVDLELADAEIDWPQIILAVAEAPDGEFVKIDAPDARVEIGKAGGRVRIDVTENGGDQADVTVTIPLTLLDAFSVDEQNRLDVAALLTGFENLPAGDLVRVASAEADVRIWIE